MSRALRIWPMSAPSRSLEVMESTDEEDEDEDEDDVEEMDSERLMGRGCCEGFVGRCWGVNA